MSMTQRVLVYLPTKKVQIKTKETAKTAGSYCSTEPTSTAQTCLINRCSGGKAETTAIKGRNRVLHPTPQDWELSPLPQQQRQQRTTNSEHRRRS